MSDTALITRFSEPSAEDVEHWLRELEYDDRFVGHKMSASAGSSATNMYGLKDAVVFLVGTKWDQVDPDAHKVIVNWIDVKRLVAWLRESVGDVELAEAIAAEVLPLKNYKAQNDAIAVLLIERMAQYRAVLQAGEQSSEESAHPESTGP